MNIYAYIYKYIGESTNAFDMTLAKKHNIYKYVYG